MLQGLINWLAKFRNAGGTSFNVELTAGTAKVGQVSIDQTTPGTTNGVQVNAALPAGTNIVGKVGIDQATANANEVVVKSITAGSNIIGKVGIDQTTDGTTNKVQARNATHDNFSVNANLQIGDIDNAANNPAFTKLVGSNTRNVASDTITIGTGAAHTAGDVVSTDAGEILQFATGLSAASSGIILDSLVTLGQDAVFSGGAGYYLYLFSVSPTAQATNAVFDLANDDLAGYIGRIDISTLVDLGSNCAANDAGHNLSFNLAAGDTNLYGKLVCKGGETTVSAKIITIKLGVAAL